MTNAMTGGELEALLQRGYRYALSLTHDESRAEDLLQDAVVGLLRHDRLHDGGGHAGYLFATIRNRFIDRYRKERFLVMESLEAAPELALDEPDDAIDGERLELALGTLRPQEREALYLAAVEDYTAREIGDLTGRPRNTVLSLIHRARAKLRDYFARRPHDREVQA
ncbi:MAG: RNA polymerase sigma factor [Planctomycetota bacterium]|jgi:RNA polymerase sigma-70 factor (ECF subfamily)